MISPVVIILKVGQKMNLLIGERSKIILTLSEFFLGRLKSLAANRTFLVLEMTLAAERSSTKFCMVGESLIVTCGSLDGCLSHGHPSPFFMDLAQLEKVHLPANCLRRPPTLLKPMRRSFESLATLRRGFGGVARIMGRDSRLRVEGAALLVLLRAR